MRRAVLALVAISLLRVEVVAQSTYGGVVGTVSDAAGAVVPAASVRLTEVQTNIARIGQTNAIGTYEFVNVPQGVYKVEIQKSGFQQFTTAEFPVAARQTVRIDATLSVSGVAEQVQVTTSAPIINTETPTIASAKSNRELQQLPFVFRVANTSPIPAIAVLPEVQKASGLEFSLSGSLPYQNEISIDGILATNVRRNGVGDGGENVFPSMETIQEMKVSSINNNAEFAQMGDVTVITRGGTNSFHGTAFWNYNGNTLDANPNYFSRNLPARRVNNNAGGSLGGPVIRDKTFFFGAYERLSIYGLGIGVATVPEAPFRTGDFSSLATPLIDPQSGLRFSGNVIPSNRINPVSKAILDKYIPEPNTGARENRYAISASTVSNQYDARGDHTFSDRHNMFGRFSWKDWEVIRPTFYQSAGPLTENRPTKTLAISDNLVIRANLINEARFGFTRSDILPLVAIRGLDFIAATGINLIAQNPPDVRGSTYIDITGYTRFGEPQEEPLHSSNWEGGDNLTWIRGRHTVKGGFNAKRFAWDSPANFTGADDFGVFRFNNNLNGGTGHAVANFLLGIPTEVDQTQTGPGVDGVAWHYGLFVQDEWRVTNRMTVSLGVRYELHMPFKDRELNITNFLRDTPNGDAAVPNEESLRLAKPAFTSGLGTSRLLTAKEAGLPETLRVTDKNNIAPRAGIAWRPFGNNETVLRAGYGIYHTRLLGAVFNSLTAIHTSDNQTYGNSYDASGRTHAIIWPRTFAGDPSRGAAAVGNQNFSTANDPYFRDPYTQQWSFTIERELRRDTALRLTYSGHSSVHLTLAPDLNQIQPNTTGFRNLPRTARPYPNWNRVNTRDNGGNSVYHDFTAQLNGRFIRGLTFMSSYKWAKGLSNVEDSPTRANSGNFAEEIASRTDNRFDGRYFRGQTAAIPNQRFTTDFIWDLPWGRGRRYGSNWHRAVDSVAGGWTFSGIVTLQSGQHLTPYYSSHCGSGTNCYGNERADLVPGQDPNNGPRNTEQWFNTGAFSNRAFFNASNQAIFLGRFGNAGKGIIGGPGMVAVDFGAFKDFTLSEQARLTLQTQIRNLPNHPNFGNPDTNLTSGNYGRIRSLNANAATRVVVLGVRVRF